MKLARIAALVFIAGCVLLLWGSALLAGGGAAYYLWLALRDESPTAANTALAAFMAFVVLSGIGVVLARVVSGEEW